jgi:hypothetical protein
MASGRAVDWENPLLARRNEARTIDWDQIRELHQSTRSCAPHREAGHTTAPDHLARNELNHFAGGGRPHMIVYFIGSAA